MAAGSAAEADPTAEAAAVGEGGAGKDEGDGNILPFQEALRHPVSQDQEGHFCSSQSIQRTALMLALIGFVLIVLWIIGLFAHVAGGFIHLLLVIALIMFVLHVLRGKTA
jgi:hypothetical protein